MAKRYVREYIAADGKKCNHRTKKYNSYFLRPAKNTSSKQITKKPEKVKMVSFKETRNQRYLRKRNNAILKFILVSPFIIVYFVLKYTYVFIKKFI